MQTPFTAREAYATSFIALLTILATVLPAVTQPESYHGFADQRHILGIPHFCDVMSNLIFIVVGAIGLLRLWHDRCTQNATLPIAFFFGGLFLTGFGSAYYHWAPDSQTLLWDRIPMVVTFAGVIGAFLCQRVSTRAGFAGVAWALALGAAGLALSASTGNLTPYLTLQFGGLVGLIVGLVFLREANDAFPWPALLAWYGLAKMLELGDVLVWDLTGKLVSGHTLKHLAAGMAGVVLLGVYSRGRRLSARAVRFAGV